MSLNADDEILQDFLVEAGELLEGLSEQLVDLERNPDDRDLLNSVFRSFHTIKGGAGFLNLTNLVAVCHRAEDVFNVLRQGQRAVDSELMDAVLQVLDVVNGMFEQVRSGEEPDAADPSLLQRLEVLAKPGGPAPAATAAATAPPPAATRPPVTATPAPTPSPTPVPTAAPAPPPPPPTSPPKPTVAAPPPPGPGDTTDEEFESLLDNVEPGDQVVSQPMAAAKPTAPGNDDEITEEEFEKLLDVLHGEGGPSAEKPTQGDELITEDEFDRLLDELHGEGKSPSVTPAPEAAATDLITEEEFDRLLDELHGEKGVKPDAAPAMPDTIAESAPIAPAEAEASAEPVPPPPPPAAKPAASGAKPGSGTVSAGEATVRVDTKRLDDIMNLVGELVLVRNRLATLRAGMQDEQVSKAVSNLDVVTADLQAAVMKTRMQPIKKVFGRFPRVVRDLARSLKKEIELELQGEETDLDKNLVEALADPLVHLVRNAVDHGIETPEERIKAGKPRVGRVLLAATQEGDHILLTISDDGKGMDADILREKAVEKGLMDADAAARLTDQDAFNLIFMAGFSTKTEISDVSGRGVGMDVVKTRIAQLNGRVEIDSVKGEGSILRVKVPLTLAILPTLMVVLGQQRFALPLASVSEIFNLDLSRTNHIDDQEVVMVRNHALPLFYLRHWLVLDGGMREPGRTEHVVVVFIGNRRVGLVVDRLIGQEEVVIKPLGAALHGLAGFAGATITGDGGIALILDVPSLLRAHGGRI